MCVDNTNWWRHRMYVTQQMFVNSACDTVTQKMSSSATLNGDTMHHTTAWQNFEKYEVSRFPTFGVENVPLKFPRTVFQLYWDQLPYLKTLHEPQGRSQDPTVSASDPHNVQANILNPFYYLDYKMNKKIRKKYGVNRSRHSRHKSHPNRYNASATVMVYVSNGVTIPINSVTS